MMRKYLGLSLKSPALALAAILLISAPQIAAAGPTASGKLPGTLSVGDTSVVEGDTQVLVPVTFTGNAPNFEFTITAFTGPGDTATDGADYTGRTTTLTGTGLPQTKIFNIEIHDDTEVEGNETFTVKITGVGGAGAADVTIGDDTATVTITPDGDTGGGGGNATVSINDVTAVEGDSGSKNFSFTVTLSAASDAFTVQAATADGSATAGSDYTAKTSTLSFNGNAGETKTFNVSVNGDSDDEGDETFFVNLSNIARSAKPTIGDGQGVGTIEDDDGGGGGGGGGGDVSFTISPSTPTFCDTEGCERELTVTVTGAAPDPWIVVASDPRIKIIENTLNQQGGIVGFALDHNLGDNLQGGISINGQSRSVFQYHDGCASARVRRSIQFVHFFLSRAARTFEVDPFSRGIVDSGAAGSGSVLGIGLLPPPRPAFPCSRVAFASRGLANGARPGVSGASAHLPGRTRNLVGDDLQTLGANSIEFRGSARGAWSQAYNDKGKRVWNFFAGKKFTAMYTTTVDTDGKGKAEVLFLGGLDTGVRELQLRSDKGALRDRKTVGAAGTLRSQLFALRYDGTRGDEIGIATTAKKGTGHLTVWGTSASGKKLQKLADHAVIGAKSAFHQWLRLDTDNDGSDEVVAAYSGGNGRGSTLLIVDPRSGKTLLNKKVLSAGFDEALWTVGDFDSARPGGELLVGYRKTRSRAFFKVLAANGNQLSKSGAIAADPVLGWGTIRSRPGPKGAVRRLVVVGFTRPNGDAAFEVWDPSRKKAKRVGGGTVAGKEYEVLGAFPQEFDGNADNGDEIVVVTRHLGDGNVGFQMFGRDGKASGSRVQVFDGSYAQIGAAGIVFARKGRKDLALMGRKFDAPPEIQVWNVKGAVLLKKLVVLGKDVG